MRTIHSVALFIFLVLGLSCGNARGNTGAPPACADRSVLRSLVSEIERDTAMPSYLRIEFTDIQTTGMNSQNGTRSCLASYSWKATPQAINGCRSALSVLIKYQVLSKTMLRELLFPASGEDPCALQSNMRLEYHLRVNELTRQLVLGHSMSSNIFPQRTAFGAPGNASESARRHVLSLIGASASGIRGLRGARVVVMLNSHLDSLTRALDILEAEYILGKTTDKQIRSSGQTFFGLSCAFVDLPVESVSLSFNDRLDRFHNIALEFEWSGRAIESVIMIRSHSPRIESRIRENPRLQNLIDLAINYTKTSFRCLAGYPKRDRIYIGIKEEPIAAAEDPAIKPEVDCSRTSFHYPRDALRAEAAGRVRVRFGLNQSGEVTHTEILRSAGNSREHKLLDQAALDRLAGCTFRAARDHLGVPVSSIAEVEFAFRIE